MELADGTYSGLSSEGLSGEDDLPVLDGTLNIDSSAYEDTVESLRTTFKKLELNISGEFYIRFIDNLVSTLCANNWGDGTGTSKSRMENITALGNVFAGADIKSFNELVLSKITSLTNEFAGCSKLTAITLPDSLRTLSTSAFAGSRVILDLSGCTYITDLTIDSDDIIEVMPEANDNLKKVTYNSGSSKIKMVGYSNVNFEINNKKEITDFWVEDCNKNLPILSTLFYTWIYDNSLQYIRAIGFDENLSGNGRILDTLLEFAENGYHGINEDGDRDDSIIPVLSGKLRCSADYSPDKLYSLKSYFPNIQFNMTGIAYIDFKDAAVKKICTWNWGNGYEITVDQAAAVTNLGTKFKENSEITSFDELKYFNSIKSTNNIPGINAAAFSECTSLVSITIPESCKTIGYGCFFNNSSLESLVLPNAVDTIEGHICRGCTKLSNVILSENLQSISSNAFNGCVSLVSIVIPASVLSIDFSFGSSGLKYAYMKSILPPTVQPLKYSMNGDNLVAIYVPVGSLSTYRTATNWSAYANKIVEYDFDENPDNVR